MLTSNDDLWPAGCVKWLTGGSTHILLLHQQSTLALRLQPTHNSPFRCPSLLFINIHNSCGLKWLRIINAHEYLADESLVKPFLFGSVMSQSSFPFRASSARFNGLYLLKVPLSTYAETSHNLIYCDWIDSINRGYVWGGTIAPVAMCESIILNSAEEENHFCGRCHLLFKPLDHRLAFRLLRVTYILHMVCFQQY